MLFDPRNPNDGLIASQQQGYWQIVIPILLLISMQTIRLLTHTNTYRFSFKLYLNKYLSNKAALCAVLCFLLSGDFTNVSLLKPNEYSLTFSCISSYR